MASETEENCSFGGREGTFSPHLANIRLSDCKCPICMSILIEPVRMPCNHELCRPCFKKNVEEANFTCPMCRLRISSWARRSARENTLINHGRWRQIRQAFPDQCRRRMEGEEDDEHDEEEMEILPVKRLCEPGAIRQEYNEAVEKLKRERQQMEEVEIKKSEEYIAWLQREEVRLYEEHQDELARQQKLDEELAWKISQGDKALENEVRAQMLREQAVKDEEYARQLQQEILKTRGPGSMSSPSSSVTKVVSKKTSRNSSRTSTSSSVKCHRIDAFLSPTAKPPSPSSRSSSKASSSKAANNPASSPVPSVSSERASSSSVGSCICLDFDKPSTSNGECAEPILIGDPPWGDRSSSDCILEIVGESTSPGISYRSPSSNSSSSRSLKGSLLGAGFVLDPTENQREDSEKETASKKLSAFESVEKSSSDAESGESVPASISRKRSDSMTSTDSISPELNHFRPIDVSPRTSHRRLSNGKKDSPEVIHTTPRNLATNMNEDRSRSDSSLPPLVKAKFESLIKEKKKKLNETSKATMTGRVNLGSTSTLMRQELNKRLHRKPSGNGHKVFISPARKPSTKSEKSPLANNTPKAKFFHQLESKRPVIEKEINPGERLLKEDAKQINAKPQQDDGDAMSDLVNLKAKINTSDGAENGTEIEKPMLVNGNLKHTNGEHKAQTKEADMDARGKRKSCSPKAQNKRQKLGNNSPEIKVREVSSGGDNEESSVCVKKSPGKVYRMRANRPQPKQSSIKQLFKDNAAAEQDYSLSPKRRKLPSGGGSPLPMLIPSPLSSKLRADHRKEKNQENVSSCETEQNRVDVATPDKSVLMDATHGSNREQKWDSDRLVEKTQQVPLAGAKSYRKSPEIRANFVGKAKMKLKNTSPLPSSNHQMDQSPGLHLKTPSKTRRNTIWKYMELVGEEQQRIRQEEEDRKLAMKLQKEFDRQERRHMLIVDRSQGSEAAYELRGRSQQSVKKTVLVDEVDSDDDIFA